MKVIFSKQELKRQKNLLKRFKRYLPTLTLKMQQLKISLNQIEIQLRKKKAEREEYIRKNQQWIHVFGEQIGIERYMRIQQIQISSENLAGISIPSLVSIEFADLDYDLFQTPVWIDNGIAYLKERINIDAEIEILNIQHALVDQELRTTTQRVNLFEKIRIPQTEKNISQIVIYLGDQYTAAVVRSKIAKKKLVSGATAS